jgi:hypothetical protein
MVFRIFSPVVDTWQAYHWRGALGLGLPVDATLIGTNNLVFPWRSNQTGSILYRHLL